MAVPLRPASAAPPLRGKIESVPVVPLAEYSAGATGAPSSATLALPSAIDCAQGRESDSSTARGAMSGWQHLFSDALLPFMLSHANGSRVLMSRKLCCTSPAGRRVIPVYVKEYAVNATSSSSHCAVPRTANSEGSGEGACTDFVQRRLTGPDPLCSHAAPLNTVVNQSKHALELTHRLCTDAGAECDKSRPEQQQQHCAVARGDTFTHVYRAIVMHNYLFMKVTARRNSTPLQQCRKVVLSLIGNLGCRARGRTIRA